MYNFGLTAVQKVAYEKLLQSHHTIEIGLSILNMDMDELSIVSNRLLDGQITIDATSDITRGLDLDLLDPTHALHMDSKSPNDGAMFADRMVRVRYSVINPTGTARYTCPVFTGPLVNLDRSGVAVHLNALGKECLGMSKAWTSRTFKKGVKVTDAIKFILREVIGENSYVIPNLANKLPRDTSVGGDKLPWPMAKALASSLGYQLFYDGMGVCRMRRISSASMFTFAEGPGGSVKSNPEVGFDIDNVINAVEVLGKKPEKKKGKTTPKRPHARAVAPRSHELSPWSLGSDGAAGNRKPRYIPEIIEDDGITTQAQANTRANERLARGLVEAVEVKFDALVIPHLEERDVVRVNTEQVVSNFALNQFAIPLTASAQMSVGYVRNVKPNKSAIRARAARK